MALGDDMCRILSTGMEKERAAHDFYVEAADKTENNLGRKMFQRLAEEETKHQELLQSWSAEGACPAEADVGSLDPDFIKKGRQEGTQAIQPETGDLEALEVGRNMERQAIEFYETSARQADDEASRDLLLRLKAEEDKHLALLTDLQEYMKDPNLWSVREGKAHFDS